MRLDSLELDSPHSKPTSSMGKACVEATENILAQRSAFFKASTS